MYKNMAHSVEVFLSSWVFGLILNFIDGDEIKVFPETVLFGSPVSLQCNDNSSLSKVEWFFDGNEVEPNEIYRFESEQQVVLSVDSAVYENSGTYNCIYEENDSFINKSTNIIVHGKPVLVNYSDSTVSIKKKSILECIYFGHPLPSISWTLPKKGLSHEVIVNTTSSTITSKLLVKSVRKTHNGTYECIAFNQYGSAVKSVSLTVQYPPIVKLDRVLGVDKTRVFLNWTIDRGNAPIEKYLIQYMKENTDEWIDHPGTPSSESNRFIVGDLDSMAVYQFKITAVNKIGQGESSKPSNFINTLSKDPVYKPNLSITGNAPNSITVAWSPPPKHLEPYIQYFTLEKIDHERSYQVVIPSNDHTYYLWTDLLPGKVYGFQIQACCEYTDECGPFSDVTNGTTMDGESGPPVDVNIKCQFDNVSLASLLYITWAPPQEPNGQIISYQVQVGGEAHYLNEQGSEEIMLEGPATYVVDSSRTQFHLAVTPNTNYSVHLCAITRLEKCGASSELSASSQCSMPPSVPSSMPDIYWRKLDSDGHLLYKLRVPRISERNGPICCYRIIIVRLQTGQEASDLPPPENISISTYEDVHLEGKSGAYVADMFENHNFQQEIVLGDEELSTNNPQCIACFPTEGVSLKKKRYIRGRRYTTVEAGLLGVQDGALNPQNNYTGFVEIRVLGPEHHMLVQHSNYFSSMQLHAESAVVDPYQVLSVHLGVILGLLVVVTILLLAVIFLQRYSHQMAEEQGVEMTFRNSIRYFWQSLRGRQPGFLMAQEPPDVVPIPEDALVETFKSKHKDSDLGFRHEFDQLPEGFTDRTTESSDCLENSMKNRYPDIKAYDQTRVKLSQIDAIPNSDYINANFVMGYRERKRFICAQGPLETTLQDFWRMIWEHRVDIIVMLTNFEENGRMKCVHYWDSDCPMDVGDVTISCSAEKRYSDYILRRLKAERKRPGEEVQVREISHFHYLVWKDFMAPEHPVGILKFIRRVNEVYSPEKGPILIHCSAGVGRTGTFVAIDSLLQELANEKSVSIFNTICDLRHQRNYLVQSLKQYIFVYRALMEMTQFGYTEVEADNFDSHWKHLHESIEPDGPNHMQLLFENLSKVIEDRKALNVGGSEVNSCKNRYDSIIPYDQNRVVLVPSPLCLEATYINASFIQGYDHSLNYIIAQDPMESTKLDFWRMILDQNVSFIVMLSEDGEDDSLCPQYWPDQAEKQFEHISIILESLTTMPDYIRRELSVTNTKTKDIHRVTQLQYLGWMGDSSQLPNTTSTLLALSEIAIKHIENSFQSPLLVHCSGGSDRSSIFVVVCILLQEIKNENRVDVFQTVRNIRSQRLCMIQTLDQFKFCYQTVHDYLRKNKSLSSSSSSPSTSPPSNSSLSS